LYLGNIKDQDVKKIMRKIKLNKYVPDIYIISFASNPLDLLDIIPEWQICQKGYPKEHLQIIGLAYGNEVAKELVRQIIDEAYQVTGHTDVRTYLKGKWRDEQWK
jgi:hypothetical protein